MHYTIETTDTFLEWFDKLKDKSVKNKILARLTRIENGNFGDHKQLSSNLFELRFFFGSGFRVYYIPVTIQDAGFRVLEQFQFKAL